MFDIGFFEVVIVAVVALLVVGPERLPKLAVSAGKMFGQMRRIWLHVQYEVEREVHNAEIKEYATNIRDDMHEVVDNIDDEMHALKQPVSDLGMTHKPQSHKK